MRFSQAIVLYLLLKYRPLTQGFLSSPGLHQSLLMLWIIILRLIEHSFMHLLGNPPVAEQTCVSTEVLLQDMQKPASFFSFEAK